MPRKVIPRSLWWLTRQLIRRPGLFIRLGDFESSLFEDQLSGIAVDRPIFVCGLARAGTTITLELLAGLPDIASYRYRDFPGVHLPLAWNRGLGNRARERQPAMERLHGDGIEITADSPEALDEPIWMSFFPHAHDPTHSNLLDPDRRQPAFERFYRRNLQKILLLRHGRRIVLKGNYLVSRLAYLVRVFPDARFVLLVRDPVEHVGSLMRQQVNFTAAAEADPRVIDYLRALGHFEFGLDRRPINLGDDAAVRSVMAAWTAGREVEGWALYWRQIHDYLADLLEADEAFRRAALVVRFEMLHTEPQTSVDRILGHCGLATDEVTRKGLAARLHAPAAHRANLGCDAVAQIRTLCGTTAARFGYSTLPARNG
jgi:Sulfotransferase family